MANPSRASARGPSSRRYKYTPELLAHGRHRYEHTDDSITDIAVEFGVHKTTLLRLAKREGWVRYAAPARDLSAAAQLAAAAEALEEAAHAEARDPEVRAQRASQGEELQADEPSPSEGGLRPTPQDDGEGAAAPAGGGEPQAAAAGWIDPAQEAQRLLCGVRAELDVYEAMRARLKHQPQSPLDAERTARTLSSLTSTLHRLHRLLAGQYETSHHDDYDDFPTDIDAFRDELARRIDAFVASRTEPDNSGGTD